MGAGPASLTVPGLTILHGGQYADTSDPDWTLDTSNGAQQTVTRYVKFPSGAMQMLQGAWQRGVPMAWVCGDEVYGDEPVLRDGIAAARHQYV